MMGKMDDRLSALSTVAPGDSKPSVPPRVPVSPAPPAGSQFQNIYFPTPDSYAGDVGVCEGFLLQCTLAITQSPHSFSSDSTKTAFVLGLLKGKALAWAQAFFKINALETYPFAKFIKEFRKTFHHPLGRNNAPPRDYLI